MDVGASRSNHNLHMDYTIKFRNQMIVDEGQLHQSIHGYNMYRMQPNPCPHSLQISWVHWELDGLQNLSRDLK